MLLLPEGADLAAHTSAVNAEVAAIHRSRSESTPGCPCSPLVPEDLERFSPSSLKAEALQRGLPAAGGKKALIQRICEHSMQNLGCCQAAVDALEAGEGEGEGEDGSSTSAEEAKWAATLAQDTRMERVHSAALKLHESVCKSWAEGGGVAGGASGAAASASAPVPAAVPGCSCMASGEGCHRDCGCMPSYCCNGPEGGARDPAQDEHYLRQFRSLILALVTHHGGAQLFFEEAEVHEWRARMVVFLQGYLRECAGEEVELEELEELALDPKVLASELGGMTEGAAAAAAEAKCREAGAGQEGAGAGAGGGAGQEGSFEALCRETLLKAMMAEAEAEA